MARIRVMITVKLRNPNPDHQLHNCHPPSKADLNLTPQTHKCKKKMYKIKDSLFHFLHRNVCS